MKKNVLLIGILISGITILSACDTNNNVSVTNSTSETVVSDTTTPTPKIEINSFPFTFTELIKSLEDMDTACVPVDPAETEEYTVNIAKIGESGDKQKTWIYCYSLKGDSDIIAIQISCEQVTNYQMENIFWDTVKCTFNLMNISYSNFIQPGNYHDQGFNIRVNRDKGEVYGYLNLIAYVDNYDFSDDIYSKPDPLAPENPLESYPTVTYDEILTGNYNGQTVCIDAIIDNLSIPREGSCRFALWYPSGNSYAYRSAVHNSFSDIAADSAYTVFASAKNGDIIRYVTMVYEDGSFGGVEPDAAQIIGKANLDEVHNIFKASCPEIEYENMSRTPDAYIGATCQLHGSVFQVINENEYSAEYLIDTDYGYVYACWYDTEETRGSRFLEGDNVTIYGTFEMLKTYDTLLGKNTVPQISIVFMSLT